MPAGTTAFAIGTFLGVSATAAGGFAAFAVGLGVQTAIGLALYALSPKPKLSAGGGYLITGNGAALDHQIIYGRTKVAGVRVFDTTEGNNGNNKFLHRVIAFTGHEIESFEKIYIDNVEILSRDGDGNVTSIDADDSDRYDGFIDIHEHLGSPDQTVDSLLKLRVGDDVNAPDWGDNHRLRGVSYLYVRMKYNADVFPSGIPEITALIKGKKVYDPRTGTTAWSDNSALCIRDYISSEYGLGEESGSIDDTSVAAAADICDQSVTDANDSSVSPRYTCNGAFTTDQQPVDILESMATSMAGILWYAQGQWRMKPGYWTPPTLSLDENDFIGPIKVNTRHSRRDNFNGVRGTYRGAASDYQQTDYPSVQDAGSLAADNDKESWADLNLTFTDTPQMAHRVARIALEQNRQQLIVQADFNLKAFKLQIGDVVNITNSRFGWTNKEFEVISWSFGVGENLAIPVTMTLRETAESIYDQIADGATYELDNTTLASPFTTQTPVLGSPVINKEVQEDGTTLISVDFSWSVTDASEIAYYDFEWKLGGASDYNSTTVSQTTFSLTGLNNQTTYDYRVRSINQLGIASPYASSSVSTGKDTTTPKAPTNVSVTGGYRLCTVRWDAPTQNTDNSTLFDLYQHKVYRGATSGFTPNDSTNLVGIVSADYFNDGGLDNNTTYHYKVKAIDYSGNESAASGSGFGTTQADISSDTQDLINNAGVQTVDTSTATGAYNGQFVIDSTDGNLYIWDAVLGDWVPAVEKVDLTGAVDVADFADGIEPVQVVSALPSSGTVGQTVYLTTDNKIYTWNGTEWTAEVAAVDIVGEIVADQIAVGAVTAEKIDSAAVTADKIAAEAVTVAKFAAGLTPVEIVGTLPATGNYAGRQVFLTTDDKLYRHTGSPLDASGWTVAVDGGDIIANTITTGAIAAGAITADEIAANEIVASKLAITDLSNMAASNLWAKNDTDNWTIGATHDRLAYDGGSATPARNAMPTPFALRANIAALDESSTYQLHGQVTTPGEKYRIQFQCSGVGSGVSRDWKFRLNYSTADGTATFPTFVNYTVTDADLGYADVREVEITMPSDAATLDQLVIRSEGTLAGGTSNEIYITDVVLQKKNGAKLIVDGTIEAVHIAAGTITADKIAANTITAANLASETITTNEIQAGTILGEDIAGNTITAANILAETITSNEIAANTIQGDNIAGNTITGDKLVANTIEAGQIAVGAIGADQIAANAITTEKLAVGDFSSKVTNYTFSNSGEGWDLDANMAIVTADSGSGTNAIATMPTPQALRANVDASELITDYSMSTPVVPGEKYLLSFDYAGVGSSISRTWRVQVYFRDTEGNFLSVETNDQTVTTTTWTETTREITVPSGAAVIYLVRIRAVASGSSNQIYITNVRLRNISSGVLIEDGSITANKIVAGGIDAESLIVNGTITGTLIDANTIEGSKIKIDGVTLDTDGSDNLIISTNGVDFTQLVNEAATTVDDTVAAGSITMPAVGTDFNTFTMAHDGEISVVVVCTVGGTIGASSSTEFVVKIDGVSVRTLTGSGADANGFFTFVTTRTKSAGSVDVDIDYDISNLTGSPTLDIRVLAIMRYR